MVDQIVFNSKNLYEVIGFNVFCNVSIISISPSSSSIAPRRARVDGGYFLDKRTIFDKSSLDIPFSIGNNLPYADTIVVSGIFLIYRIAS